MEKIKYLGHIISYNKIEMEGEKLQAIAALPYPSNVKQIQTFLGLTGYYRKFIYKYAEITAPLTRLIRQNVKWSWGPEEKRAWDTLISVMLEKPILVQPDLEKEFILDTDASGVGLGAALLQLHDDGIFRAIAFISRQLTRQEENFSVRELEGLAIFWGVNKLGDLLRGRHFYIGGGTSLRQIFHLI